MDDCNDILMAIDPGVSTGVAVKLGERYLTCTIMDPCSLWDLIEQNTPAKIAFENFATGGRVDRSMLFTVELVGSIKALCYALDISQYIQQPQMRKSFIGQAYSLLEHISHTKHEVDALAHLLCLEWRIKEGKLNGTANRHVQRRKAVCTTSSQDDP